jgi:hypothetical protein
MEKELAKEKEAHAATQRKPDLSNAAHQADGNIGVVRVVREIDARPKAYDVYLRERSSHTH